jgi:restriction endonuclease S subunit
MAVDQKLSGTPLGSLVTDIFTGVVLSKQRQGELSKSIVKIINTRDILDGILLRREELDDVGLSASQTKRYRVQDGDVLISARGGFKVGRIGHEHSGTIAGPNLVVVRPGPELESWLLYSFLRHPLIQTNIQRRSVKTTVASINIDTIADLRMKVPNISRQRKLAQVIELAERQYILGTQIAESRRVLGHEIAASEMMD